LARISGTCMPYAARQIWWLLSLGWFPTRRASVERIMRGRFTDGARSILLLASKAAASDGVSEFGADYVLLGIRAIEEAHPLVNRFAAVVLKRLGVSLDGYAAYLQRQTVPQVSGTRSRPSADFIKDVYDEAQNIENDFAGSEHLLLAITRSNSKAAEYLRRAGITYDKVLREILLVLGRQPTPPAR
jgi:ATP-dependent Clp protease ATP-binding subunit ClpB